MLTIEHLTKSYTAGGQRQTVFDGLDLTVGTGESVALLGASGSGKTTLLNLLSAIDNPDRGSVRFGETDIHALGEPARTEFRRRQIGFVFQFFNLIPTLTVGENIALPLELLDESPSRVKARVAELLDAVGLAGMADRFPETLSGGEQQRTAVARALAHRPSLLLADEPTGNLDAETGARITDMLMRLTRDQGTTLLIVTHARAVADAASRVLVLERGRLRPDA
jgi:putative ABC transport system ATP-binding protein